MLSNFHHKIGSVPTPLAGLALGIASLGWLFDTLFAAGGVLQAITACIAALLQLLVLYKFISKISRLSEELSHPVIGSILPTFSMGVMIVSHALARLDTRWGMLLWLLAVMLHGGLLCGFIFWRLCRRDWGLMLPSWFVPFVGIATAAVTVPSGQFNGLVQMIFLFALISFAVLLPFILQRLILRPDDLPEAAKPTIAILAAPASLLLAGYLTISPEPSILLLGVLLGLALLLTIIVYMSLWSLVRLPFMPSHAALTFPLVIGATALGKAAASFDRIFPGGFDASFLQGLCYLEASVAAAVIGYVALHFVAKALQDTAIGDVLCTWLGGSGQNTCIFCTTKP